MTDRKRRWCIAAGVLVCMVLLGIACRPVFYLNDDMTIRQILSGAYTGEPEGHTIYMMYPLTAVLSLLYRVAGGISWLELLFGGCILAAVSMIVDAGIGLADRSILNRAANAAVTVLVCVLLYLESFLYMHYTVVAAILGGCSCFLWIRRDRKWSSVIALLLCLLVRKQVFWLCIPFWGAAVLWNLSPEKKEMGRQARRLAVSLGVLAAGVICCFALDFAGYGTAEWRAFRKFDDARVQLYDYTDLQSTSRYEEQYRDWGLTDTQYQFLTNYNTLLDNGESVNTQLLETVYEKIVAQRDTERDGAAYAKQCIRSYIVEMRYTKPVLSYLCIALYVIVFALCLKGKYWWRALITCLVGAGRNLVWLYLIWQGRFPERIVYVLFLLEISLLFGMLCSVWRRLSGWKMFAAAVAAMVLLAPGAVNTACEVMDKLEEQHLLQEEWSELQEACGQSPEALYLLDVFSVVRYGGLQYQPDPSHLMMAGGWMTQSPLSRKVFAQFGGRDGAEALCSGREVYLVAEADSEIGWLEAYLSDRFGAIETRIVRTVSVGNDGKSFQFYRFVRMDAQKE